MPSSTIKYTECNHEQIYRELLSLFKTESRIEKWLKKSHWMLNGKSPIEMLREDNPEEVLSLIRRIQMGDFS